MWTYWVAKDEIELTDDMEKGTRKTGTLWSGAGAMQDSI
jgi:hypothetical protein